MNQLTAAINRLAAAIETSNELTRLLQAEAEGTPCERCAGRGTIAGGAIPCDACDGTGRV